MVESTQFIPRNEKDPNEANKIYKSRIHGMVSMTKVAVAPQPLAIHLYRRRAAAVKARLRATPIPDHVSGASNRACGGTRPTPGRVGTRRLLTTRRLSASHMLSPALYNV